MIFALFLIFLLLLTACGVLVQQAGVTQTSKAFLFLTETDAMCLIFQ